MMHATTTQPKQLNLLKVKAQPKVYELKDVLPFGKYQRQMLRAIAIQDPEYLLYMQTKYKLKFDAEVPAFIKQMQLYSK
jgi:hypothetical protein